MIQVKHEYSKHTDSWWYKVYQNNEHVKTFYWKWTAIRFAKKLSRYSKSWCEKSIIIFEIPD